MSLIYTRPVMFEEASYAPTLPRPLYPTYKGCTSCSGSLLRSSQPNGLVTAVTKLSGRLGGVGAFAEDDSAPLAEPMLSTTERILYGAVSVAGSGLSAYHGYKRNNSVGWALVWAFFGGLFPIITIPVALAQGYGKRAR